MPDTQIATPAPIASAVAIELIRIHVFHVNQNEMADIMGITQGTYSRRKNGEGETTVPEVMRIRDEASRRKLPWNDQWIFTGPPIPDEPAANDTASVQGDLQ